MIKFIDLRGSDTDRFAFWDTVTDKFICLSNVYAWDTWDELSQDVSDPYLRKRLKVLCPEWVFQDLEAMI